MRGGRSVHPRTIVSAAPSPCDGTKPSARAAVASRQPATITFPSCERDGAHPLQSANGYMRLIGITVAISLIRVVG